MVCIELLWRRRIKNILQISSRPFRLTLCLAASSLGPTRKRNEDDPTADRQSDPAGCPGPACHQAVLNSNASPAHITFPSGRSAHVWADASRSSSCPPRCAERRSALTKSALTVLWPANQQTAEVCSTALRVGSGEECGHLVTEGMFK